MAVALSQNQAVALKAKLFCGFADASRLSIIDALRAGPLVAGQLAEAAGLSPSNTSNHLRCLSDCGLVSSQRNGRFIRYRLSDNRVAELLDLADELLSVVARSVDICTRYDTQNNT